MNTVVLVEHPPTMLRALRESLSREPEILIVGEATSFERGLRLAARLRPDVVVLDAEMADLDVLRAIAQFRERAPRSALIVLTLEPDSLKEIDVAYAVGKVDGARALLNAVRNVARRDSG